MLLLLGDLMKESTRYTFKYNSDSDSIDLNTLLTSQIHFSTIFPSARGLASDPGS